MVMGNNVFHESCVVRETLERKGSCNRVSRRLHTKICISWSREERPAEKEREGE